MIAIKKPIAIILTFQHHRLILYLFSMELSISGKAIAAAVDAVIARPLIYPKHKISKSVGTENHLKYQGENHECFDQGGNRRNC